MTNLLIEIFTPKGFIGFLEALVVFLEITYIIFAFILIREVHLMNKSFTTNYVWFFKFFALIHFILSVGLVLLSLLIL